MLRSISNFCILVIITSCTGHEIERKAYNLPDKATHKLKQIFRIEEPAPGSFFINHPKVHIMEDGNLVIQNYPDHQLYELTMDGELVQTIGRDGRGPSEFQETYWSFVVQGDSLHVFDPNNGRHQVLKKNNNGAWEWQRERVYFFMRQSKMESQMPGRIYQNKDGDLYGEFKVHPGSSAIDTLSKAYLYIAKIDRNLDQISENSRIRPGRDVAIVRNQQGAMNTSSSQFSRGFYNFDPHKNEVVYITNTSNEIIIIDSSGNEKVSGHLPFQRYPYDKGKSLHNAVLPPELKKIFESKLLKFESYYRNVILHEDQLWVNLALEDRSKPNWVVTSLTGEVMKSFKGPEHIVNARIKDDHLYGGEKEKDGAIVFVSYQLMEIDE